MAIKIVLKFFLLNKIMVYSPSKVGKLFKRVYKFFIIWEIQKFVNILSKQWITIFFCSNWKTKFSDIWSEVYNLGNKLKKLINKIFDKMQAQDYLVCMSLYTSFKFFICML